MSGGCWQTVSSDRPYGYRWGEGSFTTCLVSGSWLQKEFQALLTSVLSPAVPLIWPFLQRSREKTPIQAFLACLILNLFLHIPFPTSPHPPVHAHFVMKQLQGKTKPKTSKRRGHFYLFWLFQDREECSYSEPAKVLCS